MPREQINVPPRRTVTLPTRTNGLKEGEVGIHFTRDDEGIEDGQHWEYTPTVFVGWDRAADHGSPMETGCVQIHMTVAADEVLRMAAEIERTRSIDELSGLDRVTFSTTVLPRPEVQKGIRALRRARDAAFEADE